MNYTILLLRILGILCLLPDYFPISQVIMIHFNAMYSIIIFNEKYTTYNMILSNQISDMHFRYPFKCNEKTIKYTCLLAPSVF